MAHLAARFDFVLAVDMDAGFVGFQHFVEIFDVITNQIKHFAVAVAGRTEDGQVANRTNMVFKL